MTIRVLQTGLHPERFTGLTEDKLRQANDDNVAMLRQAGFDVVNILIRNGDTPEDVVSRAVKQGSFDALLIGAGVRLVADNTLRTREMALLWGGLSLSAVGDQLYSVTLSWIAVAVFGPAAGYLTSRVSNSCRVTASQVGRIWPGMSAERSSTRRLCSATSEQTRCMSTSFVDTCAATLLQLSRLSRTGLTQSATIE